MNVNDFTRLYESISNNTKCHNFNKTLEFFDASIFKKLHSNKVFPSKSILLDCLTPGSIQFLVNNYTLEMKEISLIATHVFDKVVVDFNKEPTSINSQIFDFLIPQVEVALMSIDEEAIIAMSSCPLFYDFCETQSKEIYDSNGSIHVEKGNNLSKMVPLSKKTILDLFKNNNRKNYVLSKINLLWATTLLPDEEIKEISEKYYRSLSSGNIFNWDCNRFNDAITSFYEDKDKNKKSEDESVERAIWDKVSESEIYANFLYKIILEKSCGEIYLKRSIGNLLNFWHDFILEQYKKTPRIELAKMLAINLSKDKNFNDLYNMGVTTLPYSEFCLLSEYNNIENTFTTESINLLEREDSLDLLSFLANMFKKSMFINENSLQNFIESIIEIEDFKNNQDVCTNSLKIYSEENIKYQYKSGESNSAENDLQYLMESIIKIEDFKNNQDVYNNLLKIYSKENIKSRLTSQYKSGESNVSIRFVKFRELDSFSVPDKLLVESLVEWQEENIESNLINWSKIYSDLYFVKSDCLKEFGSDLVKRFAICAVRNILTSPELIQFKLNDDNVFDEVNVLKNLNRLEHNPSCGDDSIKWLAYSPDSPALEGFFKEHTTNNSILFAKLAMREGLEIAKNSDLWPQLIWRLAFNDKSYKNTLALIFPMIDFQALSMGKMKNIDCKENIFANNVFSLDESIQSCFSLLPISYDLIEEQCEDASDEQLLNYLFLENRSDRYLPEIFLEEIFNRKLYKDADVFEALFKEAEAILSLKLVDSWKHKALEEIALEHINNDVKDLVLDNPWDTLNQCFVAWELSLKNLSEKFDNYLSKKESSFLRSIRVLEYNACDLSYINHKAYSSSVQQEIRNSCVFFGPTRFKRTVSMMKCPFIARAVYHFMPLFVGNIDSKNEMVKQIEKNHISVNIGFLEPIVNEFTKFSGMNSKPSSVSNFIVGLIKHFPKELSDKYIPQILDAVPELIYADEFNNDYTESYISALSLEQILIYTEKAVILNRLMEKEFVCRGFFKEKFQKAVYFPSTENNELFKKYPVAFAFLNLLPPLSDQKASFNGWSLALSTSSAPVFLSGLKTIINRLVQLSNSDNSILLNSLIEALSKGGVTFDLIRKPLLVFIRDYHLSLYMAFLNKIDDEDTWGEFESRFVFAGFEKTMLMFEEFAFSVVTDSMTGKKKNVIPLDDVYKDINVSPSYEVLYYVIGSLKKDWVDIAFLVNKVLNFVEHYPTIYRDLAMTSTHPFHENIEMNSNFFIAVSKDRLDVIMKKRMFEQHIQNIPELNEESSIEKDIFKL